jgi:hypothetical protein
MVNIVNRSHRSLVVSLATDLGGAMPGFLPGERGTVHLALGQPDNGVGVEVLGHETSPCRDLVKADYPSTASFSLFIDDAAGSPGVVLSTGPFEPAKTAPPPANGLYCPAGQVPGRIIAGGVPAHQVNIEQRRPRPTATVTARVYSPDACTPPVAARAVSLGATGAGLNRHTSAACLASRSPGELRCRCDPIPRTSH